MWSVYLQEGILASKKKLKGQTYSKIPANDLVKLVKFAVKNNFLNLTMRLCSRSVTAIKFTPPFTYTYMKKTETDFSFQIFFTHSYGEDIPTISFLFERMEKQNWKSLWSYFIIHFCRNLNLQVRLRKKELHFYILMPLLGMGQLLQIYTLRAQMSAVNISLLALIMNER